MKEKEEKRRRQGEEKEEIYIQGWGRNSLSCRGETEKRGLNEAKFPCREKGICRTNQRSSVYLKKSRTLQFGR